MQPSLAQGPNTPATLSVDGVAFAFGQRSVIEGLSLEFPAGAVTCILGPSGCGKTTLLRLLAGLEFPARGRIVLDGTEVAGPGRFVPPERRRVGLMFQDYALFPHLSVRDNVLFGIGGRSPGVRELAETAIARVGLSALASKYPGELSGGEQQRVALARALAPAPRVLLMDEPFSNLDRGLRHDVREETVALLTSARITTVLVTHDPDEALAVAEHIVLLEAGGVLQQGPGEQLYRQPRSLAAARALSIVNEIPGRFAASRLQTPLGSFAAPDPGPDGGAAVLCVRPEGLQVDPGGKGVPATVLSRVFRGASALLSLRVEGLQAPLRAAVSPELSVAAGQSVWVSVLPGAVVLPG